ncbi:hypothetical protein ACVPOY_13780 [Staphylococcus aureus]
MDYLQAYGPDTFTGNAHPHIAKAIQEQAAKGGFIWYTD